MADDAAMIVHQEVITAINSHESKKYNETTDGHVDFHGCMYVLYFFINQHEA